MSRVALRNVLAEGLNCSPIDIRFESGAYGRLRLARCGSPTRYFSLTRSHRLCVIAVAHTPFIGIDIEHIEPVDGLEEILRQFFPGQHIGDGLEGRERLQAFLAAWTRVEAYAKATGLGLQAPLEQLYSAVAFDGADTVQLQAQRGLPALHLITQRPAAGYIGALVTADSTIRNRTYDERPALKERCCTSPSSGELPKCPPFTPPRRQFSSLMRTFLQGRS